MPEREKEKNMKSLSSYTTHQLVQTKILEDLSKANDLYVCQEYEYPGTRINADIMVLYQNQPALAIEVKSTLNEHNIEAGKRQLMLGRKVYNFHYGILTDGQQNLVVDLWNPTTPLESITLSEKEIIALLTKTQPILNSNKTEAHNIIKNYCEQTFNIQIKQPIEDTQRNTIRLDTNDEIALFNSLLPPIDDKTICRYTTMNTLFNTINKCTQRMFAVEGMNDIEDCNYLWTKLYKGAQKEAFLPTDNTVYLMSCTSITKEDDLTMWRLYADDTKGVCVTYEINTNAIEKNGFYLRKVLYGRDNEVLSKLDGLVHYSDNPDMPTFIFNLWPLWGAFFKDDQYSVEEEVRLVYVPNKLVGDQHWVITDANQILNQYVDFTIENNSLFPLLLKKILVGSGNLAQQLNVKQLIKMMKANKYFCNLSINVEGSKIKNYRPSWK